MRKEDLRVAIVFKNFANWTGVSHIGLCVAALTNARVLQQNGIKTVVFPVRHNIDLVDEIIKYEEEHRRSLTHVIISAPWLSRYDMEQLVKGFPKIQFVIESHSNVGFLQADPYGMRLLLDTLELSDKYSNLKVGGNSLRFVRWFEKVYGYGRKIAYLPNLYPLSPVERKSKRIGLIKIGIFGAVRPLKNFMTSAAAAVAIQEELGIPIEIHMSVGGEGDGGDVMRAIESMCKGLPKVKLIKHGWQPWQDFIEVVADMDLLLQPSYTESFNMITADGILVGVPSVVSDAITWAPDTWKADSDDALDIADVGMYLLESDAIQDGVRAIEKQNRKGLKHWFHYFEIKPLTIWQKFSKLILGSHFM